MNQIRIHEEELTKAPRALAYIHAAVSDSIFTRYMVCETAKEAQDKLKRSIWVVIEPGKCRF